MVAPKAKCVECGNMAPLVMGRCAKCRGKNRQIGLSTVSHGLALRESRTPLPCEVKEKLEAEQFYGHSLSSGKPMKATPMLEGWRHNFKRKKEE